MRKLLQAACFTAVLLLSAGIVHAQYPGSDPVEVSAGADLSKLRSNDTGYNSKYKPPDWYTTAFRWAQSISDLFHGFFTPGWAMHSNVATSHPIGEPEVGMSPDAFLVPPAPANQKYYMSYGLGIAFCERGGKFPYAGGDEIDHIIYLQIPIPMVRFNYILPGNAVVYAEGGAYYGIALAGGWKSTGDSTSGSGTFKFGNSISDDYRRGDWGLKFGIGFKPGNLPILVALSTDLGLRNLTPGGDPTVKINNRSIGLRVGYRFGFSKH